LGIKHQLLLPLVNWKSNE